MPAVTVELADGSSRGTPVRRENGELRLDLGGTPVDDVARVVVDWPAAALAATTLVDTPGLASIGAAAGARTERFVDAEDGPGADAVVFLTRQVQSEDLAFLGRLQAAAGVEGLPATTLTVLSRADEVGSGRLDSLLVAEETARRTAADPAVRALSVGVVPVAGLLGLAGRTLRQQEFAALQALASAEGADLEVMLLSADRFCRTDAPVPVAADLRAALLERLGLFGIRLALALLRSGVRDAPALADELVRRSGLAELERLLAARFTRRSDALSSAAAVRLVQRILRAGPRPGSERLEAAVERIRLGSADLTELDLLARLRAADPPVPADRREEAERLLGAGGTTAADRLGLAADAPEEDLRAAAVAALRRWRGWAGDPLARRREVSASETVARSCEAVLAGLAQTAEGSAPGGS
jgi:hypothetical protein